MLPSRHSRGVLSLHPLKASLPRYPSLHSVNPLLPYSLTYSHPSLNTLYSVLFNVYSPYLDVFLSFYVLFSLFLYVDFLLYLFFSSNLYFLYS